MATKEDYDRIGNYARMYNPDQSVDRRGCERVVPMEVLSLGYSRTGTMSMYKALEILGYPNPYHFSTIYDRIGDCDRWIELINAKFEGDGVITKAHFDSLLGLCGAITDMPAILFAAELIEYYPDAKIVMVERDVDNWFKSWSDFLDQALGNPIIYHVGGLDPEFVGKICDVGKSCTEQLVGNATTVPAAKARSKEQYKKHYALVRSLASRDRLLEYDLASGWGPLCKFLGKPIPDVPFPRVNDSASNKQSFIELAGVGIKNFAKHTSG